MYLGNSIRRHVVVTVAEEPADREIIKARFLSGLSDNPFIGRLAWFQGACRHLNAGVRIDMPEYEQVIVSRDIGNDLLDDPQGLSYGRTEKNLLAGIERQTSHVGNRYELRA